jgi:hypothetical protein
VTTPSLFPELVPTIVEPVEKLSPDRRRTLRQRTDVEHGRHPLTRGRLAADPAASCGNCRFRSLLRWHNRTYPKCVWDYTSQDQGASGNRYYSPPRVAHSASSDVRAWWPGCVDHEFGDVKLSADAARWRP